MNSKAKTASEKYNPSEIESKWNVVWEKEKIYSPNLKTAEKPFYNLMMFPYPSAEGMHVGNMYAFTGADVYGRFQRMHGYSVFEPIGLDGFGIHSENYAIKAKRHPVDQAKISEKNYYRQLHAIGNSFDWSRTVETYKPEYYKWTQWLFIQLFKAGLAYRKKAPVNFCPSCKTVLADEQVEEGLCERCGSTAEKRDLEQWFFKITQYADRLLSNLTQIDWSERVKTAQKQWIGKSDGALVNFEIDDKANYVLLHGFTGSPDANFFPWLRQELEKRGKKVSAPQLPGTDDPDIDKQVEFVLNNEVLDDNTVLFGHSLGSVVALKIVEKLKKPIKKLVLAAGFAQPKFLDKVRPFEAKFGWNFDFEKIKQNVGEIVLLRAQNDTAVPQERADYIQSKVGGEIINFTAEEDHICGKKEPIVLQNLIAGIEVFTTRIDTLFGGTFLVVSPELAQKWQRGGWKASKEANDYIVNSLRLGNIDRSREDKEKTGVFTGIYVMNPANQEKMQVWIADFVIGSYGTGAVFADAHDKRDFDFAKKYKISLKPTLITKNKELDEKIKKLEECFTGDGFLFNSGQFDGLSSAEAREKITAWLNKENLAEKQINYHLRDWLISRQRYWGPPIPLVFCENCAVKTQNKEPGTKNEEFNKGEFENPGWIAVPEKDLPVLLPFIDDYKPLGTGKAPLANHPEFSKTKCPKCGNENAKRETDVSDTFLDSSWYFLRYVSTDIVDTAFDPERVKKWLPVNMYIGGAEHSVLHLLYSRFVTMALHDLGKISFEEPFVKFRAHGLIVKDGAKMSKSKGNVIVPDEYVKKFGADTLRAYLMFMGPFSQGGDFRDTGIEGMHRFLKRVWTLFSAGPVESNPSTQGSLAVRAVGSPSSFATRNTMMHKTIKKITEDIEKLSYNTAIAALMEWYNFLSQQGSVSREEAEIFLKLIAPFAPHLSEELYQALTISRGPVRSFPSATAPLLHSFRGVGSPSSSATPKFASIHVSSWPMYDSKYLVKEEIIIVVQINGKLRGNITVDLQTAKDKVKIEQLGKNEGNVKNHLAGKAILKVIYVEGKVLNFVIE
jgi:leucyl-tRNA synthetase